MYLSAYVDALVRREMINTSFISPFMACILEFQKALTDLDKIATTPIPSAYSFHLRLTVWAYLLFLPFQIYPLLKWVTVPAVAVAAITYLGFLEIGAQIEMPFSDLDIDKFTLKIAHQLAEITSFPCDIPSSQIILSHLNQPFYPTLRQSAPELIGVAESKPGPNPLGFGAAYEACKERDVPDLSIPKASSTPTREHRHHRRHRRHQQHSSDSDPDSDSESHSSSDSETGSESHSDTSGGGDDGKDPIEKEKKKAEKKKAKEKAEKEESASRVLAGNKHLKPLPKTVRDLELALATNWRTISTETESFIGKPRQQLENRSGVEVGVLAL